MKRLNKPIPLIAAIFIVMSMLWFAVWLKQTEIIFPEISALAIGSFFYKVKHWVANPWHIWIAPTLASALGVGINFLTIQPVWKEILCLAVIVLFIKSMKIQVAPTISAGLLPVVLGLTSWIFVLSVCVLTFMIMLGAGLSRRSEPVEVTNHKQFSVVYLIVVALWIMVCNLFHLNHWLIPPIFVVAYEILHRESVTYSVGMKQVIILTLAAITGSVLYDMMPQSVLLFGITDLLIVFMLSEIMKLCLPPAFAISLLPLILPKFSVWEYPMSVFLSSFLLLGVVILFRKKINAEKKKLRSIA